MLRRLLIPSRDQWRQWSLPSKLTLVGTAAGVLGLLVSLVFAMWPRGSAPTEIQVVGAGPSSGVLTTQAIRTAIEPMIQEFPGSSPLRVFSVTTQVNNLAAAAIEPPYREFPNVILFRYEPGSGQWARVFEGLSIGIQVDPSNVLDTHTLGEAVDVAQPGPESAGKRLEGIAFGEGWIPVPYEKFIHFHRSGRESYHLDKRDFSRLARELDVFHDRPFVDTECALFDQAGHYSLSLSHDAGRFVLQARTSNNQEWTVTFTGIDGNGLLVNKNVRAKAGH